MPVPSELARALFCAFVLASVRILKERDGLLVSTCSEDVTGPVESPKDDLFLTLLFWVTLFIFGDRGKLDGIVEC